VELEKAFLIKNMKNYLFIIREIKKRFLISEKNTL